jgi:hypothetical protein
MFHRHESDPSQINPADNFASGLTGIINAKTAATGAEINGPRTLYLRGVLGVIERGGFDPLEDTAPSVIAKIEEASDPKSRPSLEIVVVDSASLEQHKLFTDKHSHYQLTHLVASNEKVHSIHRSEAQPYQLEAALIQLGNLEPSNLPADELKDYFNPALYLRQTLTAKIGRLLRDL